MLTKAEVLKELEAVHNYDWDDWYYAVLLIFLHYNISFELLVRSILDKLIFTNLKL